MRVTVSRVLCRLGLFVLALGGVALAAPTLAAANPTCGQTVTHNVTLTSDLTGCSGSGLVVGKAGITINLNGHTLGGTGGGGTYGIDDSSGYDRVTVENGTISDFYYGVWYQYTSGSKIQGVKALHNANTGIAFWYSQNGVIDHSRASGNGQFGFYLYENTHVNLTNSKATNNTDYGVYDYYSLATLDHVTSNANTPSGYGFYIEDPIVYTSKGLEYYTIENSTANHNANTGFYITGNYPTVYYQAKLVDNTANNNTEYGFYADAKAKGKGNHAKGNGTLNCWHVPCG